MKASLKKRVQDILVNDPIPLVMATTPSLTFPLASTVLVKGSVNQVSKSTDKVSISNLLLTQTLLIAPFMLLITASLASVITASVYS
jgi:hypothetical protein